MESIFRYGDVLLLEELKWELMQYPSLENALICLGLENRINKLNQLKNENP